MSNEFNKEASIPLFGLDGSVRVLVDFLDQLHTPVNTVEVLFPTKHNIPLFLSNRAYLTRTQQLHKCDVGFNILYLWEVAGFYELENPFLKEGLDHLSILLLQPNAQNYQTSLQRFLFFQDQLSHCLDKTRHEASHHLVRHQVPVSKCFEYFESEFVVFLHCAEEVITQISVFHLVQDSLSQLLSWPLPCHHRTQSTHSCTLIAIQEGQEIRDWLHLENCVLFGLVDDLGDWEDRANDRKEIRSVFLLLRLHISQIAKQRKIRLDYQLHQLLVRS